MGLLLAVDVGNTAASFGTFEVPSRRGNPSPLRVCAIGTGELKKSGGLRKFLKKNRIPIASINDGIVSSVVPSVDPPLKRQIKDVFGRRFAFVSNKSRSRVKIFYKKPSEVGADRIVNARAAMALWRGASVVIDFGTATTFDCVTGDGRYLGGVIAPGPVISAEALYQRTAKLPRVLLDKPVSILGRDTLESIQAGLYHGYRGLVKEIVAQLRKRMGRGTRVMATGGQARWILKGVQGVDRHVPHLTLLGLFHMWQDARVM